MREYFGFLKPQLDIWAASMTEVRQSIAVSGPEAAMMHPALQATLHDSSMVFSYTDQLLKTNSRNNTELVGLRLYPCTL
jgi:hypothetical protein